MWDDCILTSFENTDWNLPTRRRAGEFAQRKWACLEKNHLETEKHVQAGPHRQEERHGLEETHDYSRCLPELLQQAGQLLIHEGSQERFVLLEGVRALTRGCEAIF